MNDERHSDRHGARSDARRVRTLTRLVLLCGVLVALLAPIAWERLPDFEVIVIRNPTGDPASTPDPGIDPQAAPHDVTVIRPAGPIPPHGKGEYKYFPMFKGQPPYISACEPVPFVIRGEAAPQKGARLVFDGLQQVADATGISFEFMGYTDEIYQFNQRKTRYSWENERQALWIGWATDAEVPDLGPRSPDKDYAIGVGGPIIHERSDGRREVVGGGVVLRSGESYPTKLGPGATTGNALLHEIGHSLGLDHVGSKAELMFSSLGSSAPNGFGDGDRSGLELIQTECEQ